MQNFEEAFIINNRWADLHTHTTASDGLHSPAANVRMAKEAGLAAIGISDHDTVSGVAEALAEGDRIGVEVVPGVEISTVARDQDIHVLGYYIDVADAVFLERLKQLRDTRDQRNAMMLAKLRELGMPITLDDVMASVKATKSGDDTIGRPHIADALVRRGYVPSVEEAFRTLLGKGGAAYVNPPRIHPATAIEWIHDAGGVAVLAHPGLYGEDTLIPELIDAGLDGIEAHHSDHAPEEEAKYAELAIANGLIVTAGSDFHGARQGVLFHGAIGSRRIDASVTEQLKQRRTTR